MNADGIKELIQTVIGILALSALWSFCWRQYALDKFRQELFAARDQLFDVALRNQNKGFGFNCPAYGQIRRQIHASIRYAHRVNMAQVLVFMYFRRLFFPDIVVPDHNKERAKLLGHAEEPVQAEVMSVLCQWDDAVISYLRRTSPTFHILWTIFYICECIGAVFEHRENVGCSTTSDVSSVVWTDVALADATSEAENDEGLVLA